MPRKTELEECARCTRVPRFGVGMWFHLLKREGDPVGKQFRRTAPAEGYCVKHFFCLLKEFCPEHKRDQLESEVKQELRARKRHRRLKS